MSAPQKIPRRTERHALRVIKGGFAPADGGTANRLREKGVRIGDLVFVEMKKPRNPKFHRLVHAFGEILVQNIEAFEAMNSHSVLKRLQIEAGVGCDEMAVIFPGIGPCTYRIPRSLSFESMDESEFNEVFHGFCHHVRNIYWPSMTPEAVEELALMQAGP
mgnify:CR=1 FL=1